MTWQRFSRQGTVRAQRLTEALTWTTDGGDLLVGQPGDWCITDGQRTWTVLDAAFQVSYHAVPDGFERRGAVGAREGRAGELVETLEGVVIVRSGDWVVQADSGERWTVSDDHFRRAYAPVRP